MKTVLWVDPGVSTGIVLGWLPSDAPFSVYRVWQVGGGVMGFLDWWQLWKALPNEHPDLIIGSEKFIPLAGGGFNQSVASTTPLLIEGAMIALRMIGPYLGKDTPEWQRASCQVLTGGKTPAERKKSTDSLLRKHGYWHTGKQVGGPDANDVNSAMKHALYYATRTLRHRPTLELLFPSE